MQLCLGSLPLEILVRIVSCLEMRDRASVAESCSSMRAAFSCVLSTVTFLDLKHAPPSMDDDCFLSLCAKLSPKLDRLELDCWHLSSSCLRALPPATREIAICGADHHTDELIETVGVRLGPNLQYFAFSGFGGEITEEAFASLASQCRNLTSFAFDSGEQMDPNAVVRSVASNCPSLQELSTYDLHQDTLLHMVSCGLRLRRFRHKRRHPLGLAVTDVNLLLVVGMCPLLEELMLVDKTEDDSAGIVSDVGLLMLTQRAKTLRTLSLKVPSLIASNGCSGVGVMELANACTNLTRLELCNFRCLTDPPLYEIIHRCPGIVELEIGSSSITDASLELISEHCPSIRSLSLKYCRRISEAGLKALSACSQLHSLNIGHALGISDTSLHSLCLGLPLLKSLVLNNGQLSDSSLQSIATCVQMEELALHSCPRITNAGLCTLAKGCSSLRHLCLSFCDHISDFGVISIANHCRHLIKIRLDGCRQLSNPSVRALCRPRRPKVKTETAEEEGAMNTEKAESKSRRREEVEEGACSPKENGCFGTSRLRYLSMQNCPKLSDGVFAHLLSSPSIRYVDLARAKLTRGSILSYQAQRPLVELYIDGLNFSPTLS